MSNIEKLLDLIKTYRLDVDRYDREYRETLKRLENDGHVGSAYFEREAERAAEKKDEDLKFRRKRTAEDADIVIAEMRKNAAREKPPAPTKEMVEVLELLRMKDAVQQSELDTAVDICKSNPVAMGVCQEIAQKNNLFVYGGRSTVGSSETADGIDSLENHVRWTLRLDKINKKGEYYAQAVEEISPTGRVMADPNGALKARHDVDLRTVEELAAFVGIKDLAKFVEITL